MNILLQTTFSGWTHEYNKKLSILNFQTLLLRSNKYRSYMSAKKLLKLVEIVGFREQEELFEEVLG